MEVEIPDVLSNVGKLLEYLIRTCDFGQGRLSAWNGGYEREHKKTIERMVRYLSCECFLD